MFQSAHLVPAMTYNLHYTHSARHHLRHGLADCIAQSHRLQLGSKPLEVTVVQLAQLRRGCEHGKSRDVHHVTLQPT